MEHIQLNLLREKIEKLEKFHQIQIFEIFLNNNVSYTENRNGIFVNMINLKKNVIKEIKKYLLYVSNQDMQLETTEKIKKELEHNFFKSNKDNTSSLNI